MNVDEFVDYSVIDRAAEFLEQYMEKEDGNAT